MWLTIDHAASCFRRFPSELTQIIADVSQDPTLPRTEDHPCPKYVSPSHSPVNTLERRKNSVERAICHWWLPTFDSVLTVCNGCCVQMWPQGGRVLPVSQYEGSGKDPALCCSDWCLLVTTQQSVAPYPECVHLCFNRMRWDCITSAQRLTVDTDGLNK